jgi:hypothetical protein
MRMSLIEPTFQADPSNFDRRRARKEARLRI